MVLAALKLNGFELKYCTATLQADKEAPQGTGEGAAGSSKVGSS